MVLGFNALALAATAGAVFALRRWPGVTPALPVAAAGTALAVVGLLAGDVFLTMQLAAWGLFLWAPLGLVGGAWVLRTPRPRLAVSFLGASVLLVAFAGWSFLVEPKRLEVTTWVVESDKVGAPFTIAVISDVQTDHVGRYEAKVLALVADAEPDLVVWPGDYVPGEPVAWPREAPKFNALVAAAGIDPPLGSYAVEGNVDPPGWERLFHGTGVTATSVTRTFDVGTLQVTALSFDDSFDRDLRVAPIDDFHLVFGHGPDFALGDVQADLLVAGHTHGGQVRVPGLGPIITFSHVPRDWAAGRTDLPGGRTLVVSRGIGMERGYAPRLRFWCRPELVFIQILPKRPG